MSIIAHHPLSALMTEVKSESAIADTPEAQVLQQAIYEAVEAYYNYLDRSGLIYDHDRDLLRASGLHVIRNLCGGIEIVLKDGALDRRYGDGEDPDPECRKTQPDMAAVESSLVAVRGRLTRGFV